MARNQYGVIKAIPAQPQSIIEQKNGYDIGFSSNGNNEYELVADLQFWEQNWSVDRFLSQVTQRYAYHTVLTEATKQGFQVAEERNQQDGSIKLGSPTLECVIIMTDFYPTTIGW